jgi:opacity protein-like surface antigen
MLTFVRLLVLILVTWVPLPAVPAETMQLDVNVLLTQLDAGGSDEFKSGRAIVLQYNYFLKDWLAVDSGLMVTDRTLDQSRQDIVGDYRASVQTSSLLLGLPPRYRASAPFEAYGRLGLMLWHTELEIDEYFGPGVPGGTVSEEDTGYGYYAGIGGAHYITDRWIVQLELRHMKQLDMFEGKTSTPFDLTTNALSLGFGYRF